MRRRMCVLLGVLALCAFLALAADSAAERSPRTNRIKVTDTTGLARTGQPVEVTIRYDSGTVPDPSALRLLRVSGEERVSVPFQVISTESPGLVSNYYPKPQTFVRITFLADVPAGGSATYEVAEGGEGAPAPAPDPARPLTVTGEGVGKMVDTGSVVFELDKPSGQLLAYRPRFAGQERLTFNQGGADRPCHWNPDVWAPPAAWGHAADWERGVPFDEKSGSASDAPEAKDYTPFYYREWTGPVLYRTTRWGHLPLVSGVDAHVDYTFFAGAPFVLGSSDLDFRKGMQVQAVRDCELVFNRHNYTDALWIDKSGELHTTPCRDLNDPDATLGTFKTLPLDTPCLGFANTEKGFGIALVVLGSTATSRFSGYTGTEQGNAYFNDYGEHGKGNPNNFTYLCRALVYHDNWGPIFVPEGARYETQFAILVFPVGSDEQTRYDGLKKWFAILSTPPVIEVD